MVATGAGLPRPAGRVDGPLDQAELAEVGERMVEVVVNDRRLVPRNVEGKEAH